MKKIRLRIEEILLLCWVHLFKLIFFAFPQKHWTICERGTDARDNGYWFYKYMKENHPEQKVYYIIDKASVDSCKVKPDMIQPGSVKSYWALATAQKHISSHYASGFPIISPKLFRLCGLDRRFYFLQHGIIKNDLTFLYHKNAPMKLFVCGAKPEYAYILRRYGHPPQTVCYTGLARFDQLHNINCKNQILVMPTWRAYIGTEDDFKKSDYYICWQSFLNNDRLREYLEATGTQLIFYVHYGMQKFTDSFQVSSDMVKLATFDEYDVQTLLKESSVLITDYSSVCFDFAYMKKPMVFYQFDENEFFQNHYGRGYFDYRTMGFGEVCANESQAVESLLKICNNHMQMEQKYMDRVSGFFPLYDANNCQRIYDAITNT